MISGIFMGHDSKLHCKLLVYSNEHHLQQIYIGLALLEKNGFITLEQEVLNVETFDENKPAHLRNAKLTHCKIIVNNQIALFYDMHDSWEIDEQELINCNHYFKLMYNREKLRIYGSTIEKIHPLGLNFWNVSDTFDPYYLKRSLGVKIDFKTRMSYFFYLLPIFDFLGYTVRLSKLQMLPNIFEKPKIFFLVKAFDPDQILDHTPDKIEERKEINKTRAKMIKLLREEFGNNFIGGFAHSAYAKKAYKEYLIPDVKLTRRNNYMKTMRNCSICIATTGLHGSLGWKIAEYTATGRAIVSEKLNYEVTEEFKKNQNYLEFSTPQECLEQVKLLYNNDKLRSSMMLQNIEYYSKYVRPDQIVLHSLAKALKLNY
jgi:hypothetical protein